MDEEVFASLIGGDEAVALILGEPLNRSFSHVRKCLLYLAKGRSPDKDPGLGLVREYPRVTQGGRVLLYNAAGYSVASTLAASPYDSINVR